MLLDDDKKLVRFQKEMLNKVESCLAGQRLYNSRRACYYLGGISRATLYELKIPTVKIGRRTFWDIEDLHKYVDRLHGSG